MIRFIFYSRPLMQDWEIIVSCLPHRKNTDSNKMRRQQKISHMKGQDQTTVRDQSETYINNVPDREYKVIITKILPGLEKRGHQ